MHKEIRNTLVWIFFATVLLLTAVWQAQVSAAKDLETRKRELPPPAKTKLAVRPPPAVFTGDVVADYIARCEKGMTDQEIGWILEDFRNAGLDLEPTEESSAAARIAFYARQNRWYRDSLADGLRLSTAQSAEVEQYLADMMHEVTQAVLQGSTVGVFLPASTTSDQLHSLFRHWFFSSAKDGIGISPRGLFTSTPSQQDILDNSISAEQPDPFEDPTPVSPPSSADSDRLTLKGKTAATYPPYEDYPIPPGFGATDHDFPILKSQQMILSTRSDPDTLARFIHNVRRLHPAQLRILLLREPATAARIQQALEGESH